MLRNDSPAVPEPRLDDPASLARELERFLDAICRELDGQIREYPTPIPRCDAQFNHLYEQRASALRELGALRNATSPQAALTALTHELLQHAPYGDSEVERRLRAQLEGMRR